MSQELSAGPASGRAALRVPDVFGLRVFRRLGLVGVIQAATAVWFVANVVLMITSIQPDLANQTAIGSDSSNYYAAGLRLNAGHPMYHLSPGDRPVPLLPPPASDAALLSPPLLGVVWRPLALLGDVSMVIWWLAGMTTLGGIALWMALNGSIRRNAVIALIAPFIALCMWSGNVNPFVVALLIGVWAAHSRGHPAVAGGLLAVAAGLKLTPAYLAWWLLVRRDWPALKAFVAVGIGVAAVSLLGAGLDNHLEYLGVARTTALSGASPWSVPGFLANSGVPASIAALGAFGWVLLCGAAVWLLRARPRASFAAGVLLVLYASPVVLLGNLALILASTAPFPGPRRLIGGPERV